MIGSVARPLELIPRHPQLIVRFDALPPELRSLIGAPRPPDSAPVIVARPVLPYRAGFHFLLSRLTSGRGMRVALLREMVKRDWRVVAPECEPGDGEETEESNSGNHHRAQAITLVEARLIVQMRHLQIPFQMDGLLRERGGRSNSSCTAEMAAGGVG
jgi:hypothetical protein